MPAAGVKIEAGQIWAALVKRYPSPQYALMAQVANGTGYGASRWADALAMSLWPSRGLHLHGFEIKVGRGDWLRELKAPAKAEEIASYCHFWWIVAAEGIVYRDELPPTWGLLEMKSRGLVQVVAAPQREATLLDASMVAAILRRSTETMVPKAAIAGLSDAERDEAYARGKQSAENRFDTGELKRLKESIARFEAAAGITINEWNGKNCGARFKAVQVLDDLTVSHRLKDVRHELQVALDQVAAVERALLPGSGPKATQ